MSKIIINNYSDIDDYIALAKVFQFLTDTNILNVPNKIKKNWSFPVPITFGKYVCYYNETKNRSKIFTFLDKTYRKMQN